MYVGFLAVEAFVVWSFLLVLFRGEEGTFAFDEDDEEVAEEGVEGQLPFAPPPFVGGNGELLLLEEKL